MAHLFLLLCAIVHADEFGQPVEIDFDGKVKSVAELKAEAQTEATGFFRIREADGRFWFVTPAGKPFFLIGCDGCHFRESGYATPLRDEGRPRPEFERLKLPSVKELPLVHVGDRFNFLAWNLFRKYGTDVETRQDEVVRARLADWGFNSTGKWGWGWKLEGVPYIEDGHIGDRAVLFGGWPHGLRISRGRYVDMFHPGFAATLESTARKMTDRRRLDRDLIAYSLENENGWNRTMFNDILAAEPGKAGSFAREAFRAFLAERGRAPRRDLRGMRAGDFDKRDVGDFIRLASLRYHNAVAEAFRRLDANHLVYGESNSCSSSREWIEGQALSKIDFIGMHEYGIESLTWYRASLKFLAEHKKPFAILEYSFTGVVRGMASYKAATDCRSERARGLAYRHYTERAAQHPLCLGLSYFILYDQPFTKRSLPGEGHHFGLVSQQDRPYREMINEVKKSNARLFGLHSGEIAEAFCVTNVGEILAGDLCAFESRRLFEAESIPENVEVETDNEERARTLFRGNRARLKINQDVGLAKGVNAFGTIDLRRHPAEKVAFTFFCRHQGDAKDWPVFEAGWEGGAKRRLDAVRTMVWEGGAFDEVRYEIAVPKGATGLTVGIDVREPGRAWSALLSKIELTPPLCRRRKSDIISAI